MVGKKLNFEERLELFLSGQVSLYADDLVKECCPSASYIRILGTGAEGPAILIFNNLLHRKEVLKIRRGTMSVDTRDRFMRSAKILSRIFLQNKDLSDGKFPFLSVYDCRERPAFIRMEFIEGFSLREFVLEGPGKDYSTFERLRLFMNLAEGLETLHSFKVLHRDIKPDNILVDRRGEPKWIDFGIAKHELDTPLTGKHKALGTVLYSAPEQLTDAGRCDYRADIFSFGKVLFFLMTGNESFNPALLPPELIMIYSQATQQDRTRRFTCVEELRKAIITQFPDLGMIKSPVNNTVARAFIELNTIYGFNSGKVKRILKLNLTQWDRLMRMAKESVLSQIDKSYE